MRITGESFSIAPNLSAEMVEVCFVESMFKERTCVDAWCGVTLEVHMVSSDSVVFAVEEMVETNFVQTGRASEC